MKELSRIKRLSLSFIDKKKHKKINKIKNKEDKLMLLQHSLISELRLKHINLELKLKNIKDKKRKHLLSLKSNLIPSKINLLQTGFNEKDFKKIDSLINKLEEEIHNV
ncbi:MAG: hypothetical protein ACP5NZ_01895 [Nanobdellota archaeon]